jgi:serine/threonine-protein kinase
MATGRLPFVGNTSAAIFNAIISKAHTSAARVNPELPLELERIINKCLEKDRKLRYQTAADLRIDLSRLKRDTDSGRAVTLEPVLAAKSVGFGRRAALWGGAAVLLAALTGVAAWTIGSAPAFGPPIVSRFAITLPENQQFTQVGRHAVALSPQGTHLVYTANNRLNLRAINQLEATPIQGTEAAQGSVDPFFSPDGQWIGFWQASELRKVAITGGGPVKLSEVPAPTWGASWGADDSIVYARGTAGIWRVSGQGGTPDRLIAVDEKKEAAHGPQLLLGGRAVLFTLGTAGSSWNEAQIVVQRLDTNERKVLLRGGRDARYVETGHLVYARAGTILAVPFDLDRLEVTGGPVPLVGGVMDTLVTGATHFSVSSNGSLVYVLEGQVQEAQRRLVWVSRNGKEQPLAAPPQAYDFPQLSPDGRRVAVEIGPQIWLYDLARDTLTRLTFEGGLNANPTWTPDSKRIAFQSNKEGVPGKVFWQLADGSGGLERLTSGGPGLQVPRSWSPDGQVLAFQENHPTTQRDIWVLPLSDRKAQPFLRTPFTEGAANFSPDGRWLAYISDESGRPETYVQPYPGPGGKWQISTEGGTEPVWSRNGRELFYRSGNKMMAVETTTQSGFSAGKPRMLFEGQYLTSVFPQPGVAYDVSPDGQRFLMVKETETGRSTAQIIVVLNWLEELKQRVPVK